MPFPGCGLEVRQVLSGAYAEPCSSRGDEGPARFPPGNRLTDQKRCQLRLGRKPAEKDEEGLKMTAVVDTDAASSPGVRAGAFGNATHLVCRECGANTELGPFYACTECFGPLEVGYEFPTITRERIEA